MDSDCEAARQRAGSEIWRNSAPGQSRRRAEREKLRARSPDDLGAHLSDTWLLGRRNRPKTAAREIPVGVAELRVICQVEELRPDEDGGALRNPGQLMEPEVPVVESRAVEESTARVAHSTQRFRTKRGLVEVPVRSAVRPGISGSLECPA